MALSLLTGSSAPDYAVSGAIVTDGTIGVLAQSNIVSWNLTIFAGAERFYLNSAGPSSAYISGSDLTATTYQLLFNFSGTDHGQFEIGQTDPKTSVCFTSVYDCPIAKISGAGIVAIWPLAYPGYAEAGSSAQGIQAIAAIPADPLPEPSTLPLLGCSIICLAIYNLLRLHPKIPSPRDSLNPKIQSQKM